MKIPLTKFGWPQVVIYPAILLGLILIFLPLGLLFLPIWALIAVELTLTAVLIWALSFFRDPPRAVAADENILLAPADGKITDVDIVDEPEFIKGKALRIGIFLSVFNVHINRSPCRAKVHSCVYKKGRYKNALSAKSAKVNESNAIYMTRLDNPSGRLIVRQISGAIARHIVCKAKPDMILQQGQKFGMIKFGSRTELYLPAEQAARCQVEIGQKVKAGLTVLVEYTRADVNTQAEKSEKISQGT